MSETTRKHKIEAPKVISFAIIICSSSRYQEIKAQKPISDFSGDYLVDTLHRNGHNVISREIVPDDHQMIHKSVQEALDSKEVKVIVLSGGTGISPRDVTIEVVRPMLAKVLPGFGELFRKLSFDEIGSAAAMSRSLAGVTESGKIIFCIPGSPHAARLFLERLILPEVGHLLKHAREE